MASLTRHQPKFSKNSVSMVSPQQLLLTFVHAGESPTVDTNIAMNDNINSATARREEGSKRRTRVVWGASETRILLDVWGPKFEEIKGGSIAIKRDLWRNISREFEDACAKNNLANISLSLDQLRKRVANLEYKYRQVKSQLAVSDESEAVGLKSAFPFFDALDRIFGKTTMSSDIFKMSGEPAPYESPPRRLVPDDLRLTDELHLPLTQDNHGDSYTTPGQENETADLVVVDDLQSDLKRKSFDVDEEPYLKRVCKLWEESLERQEKQFNKIIEMQEKILANQTAQTQLLVEGLRDIVQELINSS